MTLSIKPFKAFRPLQKRVEEVVLPTFDNLTNKQLNKILKESEYNFLNVVSPKAFYPNITKKNSKKHAYDCLLYTSPSPRDPWKSRMPSSA